LAIHALVADEDLDVHELVNDILSIILKDVVVERVLNAEGFVRKLLSGQRRYDLIIVASKLHDGRGKSLASVVCNDYPAYCSKMAILKEPGEKLPADPRLAAVPYLEKPFSLDTFSETIKRLVA
jgi:DNA-binding NtrC family response regulator